ALEGLPAASGLAVELHTDARYESSPTVLKTVLLVAHALALTVLLVLAWRRWRGTGPGLARPHLSVADAVVVVVSLAWAVLGPVNIDDSWYLLMARNAQESGYVGNYVYQFNVTENPFSTSQYVMQAWGAVGGWSLLWMRVLPLVYGLATYVLLRVLVTTVLGRAGTWPTGRWPARGPAAVWALALAHLLWFLPYGITLRPEPLIALGTAGVMVLAELARRRESVGVLAAATALAALTLTVAPTGLVACAPLALALPWLGRWLRAADAPHRTAAVLVAGASASIVVLPGFADASLGDVLESTAVHRWYYRQHPWYEEFVHYRNLLELSDQGAWARRLPVLLTLAVLAGAAIAAGRRAGTGGPVGRLLATSAVLTALGLASLMLTPTKWVNHFGAVAAPATVLLAAAMLRSPVPRRAPAAAVVLATVAAGAAAAVGFAGPNLWRPFGDWGQPFGDHTVIGTPFELSLTAPSFGPLALRNPVLWLAIALTAVWWARRTRWPPRRPRPTGLTPDRAVLTAATGLTVALLLAVFVVAPLRQYPGPSVALTNVQALTGAPCGLAGDLRVRTAAGSRPITEVIAGRPVFVDQVSAVLWPCVDQIAIENGIASVPAVRLRAGEGLEDAVSGNSMFPPNGGTLVQLDRTAEFVELPSALSPVGVPTLPWGHVELVVPDHP
ncbi:MAG: arabinosyltransferase, partial [Actinomycetota bacterium]|nr:arabinosyltransferase [Actinomycetota bacterium]